MADKKITDLNPLGEAGLTDPLVIVDLLTNSTKKITVTDLMGTPGPIGWQTPDAGTFTAIELATGPPVDEISTDVNLGTNDDVLPTQKAVKAYVDNSISEVVDTLLTPVYADSDTTATIGDVVLVDTTSGDVTVTAIGTVKGAIHIKKISPDGNSVIIIPEIGTIDGAPGISLDTQWQNVTLFTETNTFYIL